VDRPHGYVPAVAPFWRREMLSSSSTGSNSWYQKSCHSPSSSKTSRAGWPGFPHLWAMVPTQPCNSALRWSFLTLTRLPICASSGLTKISLPLLTCISLKPGPSAGTFSDPRHRMLPNNFFPYLKHPHLTNAPHFVSKYTKCRRSSPEPYFLPLFTGVRGRRILRTSRRAPYGGKMPI
jgi:hypothetical protein